jgi:hypothetical protein
VSSTELISDSKGGAMTKSILARLGLGILLSIIIFWVWYSVAANYDYGALSGTYSLRLKGETSTLVLKRDRSFQQELIHEGKTERAQGSWRRVGEGGVVFSKEFIKVPGQEIRPDGQADGEFKKRLGLFPSIAMSPDPGGPTFRKKLFR